MTTTIPTRPMPLPPEAAAVPEVTTPDDGDPHLIPFIETAHGASVSLDWIPATREGL